MGIEISKPGPEYPENPRFRNVAKYCFDTVTNWIANLFYGCVFFLALGFIVVVQGKRLINR